MATALAEFRRVVRPGGLVAVKESDAALLRVLPAPTGLVLRFVEACANAGSAQVAGSLRAPTLPSWLRRAGLVDVWRRSAPIEHTAPLGPAARTLWRDFWSYTAGIAASLDLPPADQEVWGRLRDPAELERYLDDPDFSSAEGNILVVGTVPAD